MTKELAERFRAAGVECYEDRGDMVARFPGIITALHVVASIALCMRSDLATDESQELQRISARMDGRAVVVS